LRLKSIPTLAAVAFLACSLVSSPLARPLHAGPFPRVQNPDTIPAEKSTAMAKEIIQQMIAALGGNTYLTVRDSDCTGRLSVFGALTGEPGGTAEFHTYWVFPYKYRREITTKQSMPIPVIGSIVDITKSGHRTDVFNENQGWMLDQAGVEDVDPAVVATFQATVRTSFDNLIRHRLKEPDLEYRYRGEDVVDLKQADWVEITDTDQHGYRIAVDRGTHLPVRFVLTTLDPKTSEPTQDVVIYSNWHVVEGVQTSYGILREHDGKRTQQTSYDACKYNSGVLLELFTKEELQKHSKVKKPK
jgi:hypothetical protein